MRTMQGESLTTGVAQEKVGDGGTCALTRLSVAGVQLCHGPVQHFLGQAFGQGFEHGVHWLALCNHFARTGQFSRTPGLGLRVELLDQGHAAALVDPVQKALHARVDRSEERRVGKECRL